MIKVTILTIGKIKEDYIRQGINEYSKRLKPYCKIDFVELEPESFGRSDKIQKKEVENEKILKFISKNNKSWIVALHEKGEGISSLKFSNMINNTPKDLLFVIGGSLGLNEEVLKKANFQLSLSNMTFLHEIARLILVEQIYRGIMIEKGKEYHY